MAAASREELLLSSLHLSIASIQRDILSLQEYELLPTEQPSSSDLLSNNENISSGDTAWMLIATILVLGMTVPGVMLYYSGMVRLQNALSTAMQGFGLVSIVTFLWLCFGYSLSFSPSNERVDHHHHVSIVGDASRFWLHGITSTSGQSHQLAPTIPETIFCCYQLTFAIITPCLICGSFADRMKYTSVLVSLGLWHLIVYCPIAHSNWHPNGLLAKAGVLDFAGGNVVHISAGMSALVAALIIGKRKSQGKKLVEEHNLLLTLIGLFLFLLPLSCRSLRTK
jgi:ammonium transporter, Amt family